MLLLLLFLLLQHYKLGNSGNHYFIKAWGKPVLQIKTFFKNEDANYQLLISNFFEFQVHSYSRSQWVAKYPQYHSVSYLIASIYENLLL